MKKVFLTFATYAVILTSCNQNEITDNLETSSNGQLTFSPAIGKQTATRASELTNAGLEAAANSKKKGIVLYAYQETSAPGTYSSWFNDKLWYEAPNWKIESTRFRNTSKSKFISFYPETDQLAVDPGFGTVSFVTKSILPKFEYNASTDLSKQVDLVASITDVEPNATDIVFKMRHILSQVNFGVKGYKGAQISISNIEIHGVYDNATFTYGVVDNYPLGKWSNFGAKDVDNDGGTTKYTYALKGGAIPAKLTEVEQVITGDVYVFGDGGNWGPGKESTTWYPVGEKGAWMKANNIVKETPSMSNSLMLIPQDFKSAPKDAYVTFNYTIKDISGALVANNAEGQFKLDFTSTNASYTSKWEQNYRYLYIIDFTDFLNDNKLTFKVDVQAYPWENYNKPGDGIVDVPVIGQTTIEAFNTDYTGVDDKAKWYAATCSRTVPKTSVQLITSETWSWELYTFKGLDSGDSFNIKFDKVIFNGKEITIKVGAKYKIYNKTTPETEPDQQTVKVTKDTDIVVIKQK